MKKCPYCSEEVKEDAIKCKHCKEFINSDANSNSKVSKDKTTALILALIFSVYSFLYTFKIDKGKFFGAHLIVFGIILLSPFSMFYLIPSLGFWIYAIILTSTRSKKFYINYNSNKAEQNDFGFFLISLVIFLLGLVIYTEAIEIFPSFFDALNVFWWIVFVIWIIYKIWDKLTD